jgi:hypothetical protein
MSISSIGGAAGVGSLPDAISAMRAQKDIPSTKIGGIPPGAGTPIEDLPPERKAEYEAHKIKVAQDSVRFAEMNRQSAADWKGYESHDLFAPNVSTLTREQSLQHIEYMSELIQTGQAENYNLSTGYGQRTTSDFRQYVSWLQQHVKELEGAKPQTEVKA